MVDPVVLNSWYVKIYQAEQAVMVHSAEQDPDLLGASLARRRSRLRYQDRRFAELADFGNSLPEEYPERCLAWFAEVPVNADPVDIGGSRPPGSGVLGGMVWVPGPEDISGPFLHENIMHMPPCCDEIMG